MATVTSDHVRQLARSELDDPALVVVEDDVLVVEASTVDELPDAWLIYTRTRLVDEFGEDITEVEAEVLAAGLTNETTESAES